CVKCATNAFTPPLKNMKYLFLNEFIRNAGYSLSSPMRTAATIQISHPLMAERLAVQISGR
ncbi:hypothetical protein, partial [Sutterella wadsworthensis]|uniref:hypothetical protein n=1 Tax=Sutterella wadsworthensis TaxID=40545 RepID=UPI0039673180